MKLYETNFKTMKTIFSLKTFVQLDENLMLKCISIISINNVSEKNFESHEYYWNLDYFNNVISLCYRQTVFLFNFITMPLRRNSVVNDVDRQ